MNYKSSRLVNNQLYVSGQIPDTIDGTIKLQIKECVDKILSIGVDNFFSKKDLISTTVYLTDINDITVLNDVYTTTKINEITTRSTVEVSKLVKNVKVEISAMFITGKN